MYIGTFYIQFQSIIIPLETTKRQENIVVVYPNTLLQIISINHNSFEPNLIGVAKGAGQQQASLAINRPLSTEVPFGLLTLPLV